MVDRDAIVSAALSLVERDGAASWGMRDLAVRLGISPKALYGYFATKDDIIRAASSRVIAQMDLSSAGSPWQMRLRHIASECCRLRAAYPSLSRIELVLSLTDYENAHVHAVVSELRACLTEAGCSDDQAENLTLALLSAWLGELSLGSRHIPSERSASVLEALLDVFISGLETEHRNHQGRREAWTA